jgi:hypothetical protein
MVNLFAEERARLFGSFTVTGLTPATAVALLDADTLRAPPGTSSPGDVDLAAGRHVVVIRAPGYRDVTDEIAIPPNSNVERSYQLVKRHGGMWYAMRAGAAVGVGTLGVALAKRKSGSTTAGPQDLPPAPAAPAP